MMGAQAKRDPAVQAMIDRLEIEEVLLRYCRACDRVDEELLRSCFHADATDEYVGLFSGKIQDGVRTMMKMRRRFLITMHVLTNISIEVEGDTARSESYVQAQHRFTHDGAEYQWVAGGRYLDRHEKRGGVWRIAHRQTMTELSRVDRVEEKNPPASLLEV
jgi:hypothetical protein